MTMIVLIAAIALAALLVAAIWLASTPRPLR
jgi:hypothetical protein